MPESLGKAVEEAIEETGTITVDTEGRRATIHVVDSDRFSVVVDRLRVEDRAGGSGKVQQRAERLSERVKPEGRAMRPTEVAPDLGGAILRTAPREKTREFYQLEIDSSGAGLSKHRVGSDGKRQTEPFTLTREELGRIVDDMDDGL